MNAPVSVADQPLQPLTDWATRELARLGLTVTGAQEMRRRDWTLLARIDTNRGAVWAKASARAFAHEGPLLAALDRLVPGSVPKPLAVHRENGWFLAGDGGETLRTGPSTAGSHSTVRTRHRRVRRNGNRCCGPMPACSTPCARTRSRCATPELRTFHPRA
ncbi:hypothetical protein [Nocardia africana]|uniref:hypothetical protein n=1 Tax=Nocardia africana TaxID=134964 RepID=UPI000FE1B494|nr:hypothetical protein [Nocardia africana]